MDPVTKVTNKALVWAVSLLVGSCAAVGLIMMFAGMRVTGFDNLLGTAGEQVARTGFDYSVPAVGNIFGPGLAVVSEEGKRLAQDLLPDEPTVWGGVTINWQKWGVSNPEITVSDGSASESGNENGGTGNVPTPEIVPTSPPCSPPGTYALQALTYWEAGDFENALVYVDLADSNDCLGRILVQDYFAPFQVAIQILANADSVAAVRAASIKTEVLNPAWPGTYSARAFANASEWLNHTPLAMTEAKQVLAGAELSVITLDAKNGLLDDTGWGFLESDEDLFMIGIAYGSGFNVSIQFTRAELVQLETVLSIKQGSLTTVGNTITVQGSFLPDHFPSVPAPDPNVLVPTQQPATPVPPPSTDNGESGGGQAPAGAVACIYPGQSNSGMTLRDWVVDNFDQETWKWVRDNNDRNGMSIVQRWDDNVNKKIEVWLPPGSSCP